MQGKAGSRSERSFSLRRFRCSHGDVTKAGFQTAGPCGRSPRAPHPRTAGAESASVAPRVPASAAAARGAAPLAHAPKPTCAWIRRQSSSVSVWLHLSPSCCSTLRFTARQWSISAKSSSMSVW